MIEKVLGPTIPTQAEGESKIGVLTGIPTFGLDSWSSTAYGPEAALSILSLAGLAGVGYLPWITAILLVLLLLLYFSYLQTIGAYPNGGGSYTVAKDNLGPRLGTLAAASLLLDYVLNVAVGISAGTAAVVSVFPALHPYMLALCLATLLLLTVMNLRGIASPGVAFALPTYVFALSTGGVIAYGVGQSVLAGGRPVAVVAPPPLPPATAAVTVWLLVRSFASGCTAMTGVEAVSNGVPAFAEPNRSRRAALTLTVIIATLAAFLAGVAYLCSIHHIGVISQEQPGYETVLSQMVGAVVGRGWLYYITMAGVLSVLALSANTSFADFPRVCQLLARDSVLPDFFAKRGRRLVFSTGIIVLAVAAGVLLVAFGGITDRLIPLFAIGAFGAFTLSQCGMVMRWRGKNRISLVVNALGATATGVSLVVIVVAKFIEGAWITLLIIPSLYYVFQATRRHYREVHRRTSTRLPLDVTACVRPVVVVPIKGWSVVSRNALRFVLALSDVIQCVYVETDELSAGPPTALQQHWPEWVQEPARKAGGPVPELIVLKSETRSLFQPLKQHFDGLKEQYPDRKIAVVIPELVEKSWLHFLSHNQAATALKAELLFARDPRLVVINVPTYLDLNDAEPPNGEHPPTRRGPLSGK